ncbi:MAG: hypothetical protein L0191_17195, partial [Acidobacteria bacterium]|nr:hypothetical protein [Acidobacteriota bacterium]
EELGDAREPTGDVLGLGLFARGLGHERAGDDAVVLVDDDVRTLLGVLDRDLLLAFVEKVAERDSAGLLELIDQVLETGHDPGLFLNNLMEQVRDLLLLKIVSDPGKSLGLAEDDLQALGALKERFSQEDLLRIMDAIAREETRIRYSPQPRYLLEALAVRLCHLAHLEPLENLLAKFSGGSVTSPAPAPSKRENRAPIPDPAPPEAEASLPVPLPSGRAIEEKPQTREQVEAILERIHIERSALWGFLSHAVFFDLTESSFVISLPEDKALFRASIERKEYLAVIRSTVEAVTGRKVEVKVQLVTPLPAEAGSLPLAEAPKDEKRQKLMEEASKSPVVQNLLDLFQGEITEIEEA